MDDQEPESPQESAEIVDDYAEPRPERPLGAVAQRLNRYPVEERQEKLKAIDEQRQLLRADMPRYRKAIEALALAYPEKTPEELARVFRAAHGPTAGISSEVLTRKIKKARGALIRLGPKLVQTLDLAIQGALADGEYDVAAKHSLSTLKAIAHMDEDGVVERVVHDGDSKVTKGSGVTVNIGVKMGGSQE